MKEDNNSENTNNESTNVSNDVQATAAPVDAAPVADNQTTPVSAPGADVTPAAVVTSAPAETPVANSEPSVSGPSPAVLSITGNSAPSKKGIGIPVLVALAVVGGLVAGFLLNTALGHPLNKKTASNSTSQQAQQVVEKKELKLPEGAVEINACAKGRGKQFALPKDIPFGPVYNVHEGKITAIEFMPAQADFATTTPKDFLDLKLYGVEYDHVNIGLLSKGHAGYPSPHYHVDVFTITHEESNKITCQ